VALLRITKQPRVAQGLLAKAIAVVVVQQMGCKLVRVAVVLELLGAALRLQVLLQIGNLAAAVRVGPQASRAPQPLMPAVVVAQRQRLARVGVVD
jgi:hypothetical protein